MHTFKGGGVVQRFWLYIKTLDPLHKIKCAYLICCKLLSFGTEQIVVCGGDHPLGYQFMTNQYDECRIDLADSVYHALYMK